MSYKNRFAARRIEAEGAISLRTVRAWFDEQGGQDGGGSKYNPTSIEEAMKVIAALEKRVGDRDATIEQQKSAMTTLNERMTAIEVNNRKKLEEQGNFSELKTQLQAEIESLRPTAERATALEAIIRDSNAARIEKVPEMYRAMIPTDYPPEKLQGWLNANEALMTKPPAPNFNAGAGNGSGGSGTQPPQLTGEELEIARQMKISPEQYAKRKAERDATRKQQTDG